VHCWRIYDNTEFGPSRLIALKEQNGAEQILDETIWLQIKGSVENG
jgi:hypothetical protein